MASPIGAVYLAVLPDLSGFASQAARQLSGPIRRAADQAGDQASTALGKSGDEAGQRFGARAGSATKAGLSKLRGIAGAAGIGAGAALAAGLSGALSLESARATMTAQLGLTRTESAKAGQAAGSLFAQAYGDSMEEVNAAVTSVIRNIDGMRGASKASLDAQAMTAQIAKGGPAAAQGLETVLARLRAVKDPAAQSAAAVALFGTQAEDLGQALYAFNPSTATTALGQISGAADSAGKALGETSAARFEAFKRGLQTNITGAILDYGVPALNVLQKTGQALGISPSGLVAAGVAVAGVALGAKAVAASYGAAKTVVSGATTVLKGAGGAWDALRLRAMYAGDAARKAGGLVRTAGTAVANAGRAALTAASNLGSLALAWARAGLAATRAGLAAAASAVRQLAAAAAARVVRIALLGWTAAQWLLNAAMSANPLGLIILGLVALGAALALAWTKSETFRAIVMAVWNAIKTGVMAALGVLVAGITAGWNWIKNITAAVWNGGVKAVLLGVWKVIATVARIYIAIYKAIFLGAWWAIRNGAAVVWAVIKATLTGVWKVISTVAKVYVGIYTAIFKAAWWAIKNTASAVWGAIKGVVLGFLGQMRSGFSTAVAAIGRIWGGLKEAAAKPVRFVVQTVYQGGIKRIWDWLADKVGLPKLPDAPKFASGGVLGGYRPGHDSVLAMLSPGEGVLRPEAVRYLGADWVHGINKAARTGSLTQTSTTGLPGFKFGGIVGAIKGGVGGFIKAGKNLFLKGLMYAARKAFGPILSAAENSGFGKTGFGQIVTRVPRKIVDGILSHFGRHESEWLNKLGPGKVVQLALSQLGQGDRGGRDNDNKYNDAFGFPAGTAWCANFVSWVLREAGAGSHYPGYPTAAVATYSGAMSKVPRSQARPGDLGFYESGGSHVNIVYRNDGGSLTTIGGNEGPQVKQQTRNDQSSVGRPKFARGGIVSPFPARDRAVFAQRDEDPADRRNPLTTLYRKLGPRTAGLVAQALASVRPMAAGGLVTRPTLALVGEAGPELVTPVDRGSSRKAKRETPAQRKKRLERERREREKKRRAEQARRVREEKARQAGRKRLRQNLPAAIDKLNPKTTTAAAIKSVTRSLAAQVQAAFKGKVAKQLSAAINRAQAVLLAKVAKRDAIRGRLKVAQTRLDDLRKSKADFAGNVTGTARQFGSLTSLGTVYDAADIKAGLKDRLAVLRKFSANLATLAKRGLNKGLLRQLYEAGPEQGGGLRPGAR